VGFIKALYGERDRFTPEEIAIINEALGTKF
jgi:hypothetical protein